MRIEVTRRQLAILGAVLSRCRGDEPQELYRFVNIAAESVRDGWNAEEMDDLHETLAEYASGEKKA